MITFFTIPKPFAGHSLIIQQNAIRSWSKVNGCGIILFGNDAGVAEFAKDMDVVHYPGIKKNEFGTPLVSDAFKVASSIASTKYIAYVNSDIIFSNTILDALNAIGPQKDHWVMVGQRINLNITEVLKFNSGWIINIQEKIKKEGQLHGKAGIDYFLFPKNLNLEMPDFAVGRPGWDNWLIYSIRANKIPLIDATTVIECIHQNHPPAYKQYDVEAIKNKNNAGGYYKMGTIRDANWKLHKTGKIIILQHHWSGVFYFLPLTRFILFCKRTLNEYSGSKKK